jgi:hypothetical protein
VETARCLAALAGLAYADAEALLEGNFADFVASARPV